ncbi:hypothetical protein WN48_06397 [Eufriesea mexicana]|uniref:Uncharacterized protein n=1 Tax=Eufriesea mexicana TaxID=516756 RepID=A0A310SCN9_9HYME|nr:hypothetical protein WN48_06397 [Eufriesea mexicana]
MTMTSIVDEVVVGNRRKTRSSQRRLFGSPATEPANLAARRSKAMIIGIEVTLSRI